MNDTERQSRLSKQIKRADGAHHLPSHALSSYGDGASPLPAWHSSTVQQLLDAVIHPIAACNEEGVILLCNAAWLAFDDGNGSFAQRLPVGGSLLEIDASAATRLSSTARNLIAGLQSVAKGSATSFSLEFPGEQRKDARAFSLRVGAIHDGGNVRGVVTIEESSSAHIDAGNLPEDVAAEIASLSPRERQILDLVLAGEPNKLIASHLDLSQKTVEKHRSNLMRKLGAQNVVHLVRKVLGH